MNPWITRTLCLLALVACMPLAHAQTHIYHCLGAHGEPVYSGEPCGTPVADASGTAAVQTGAFDGVCADSPRALQQSIASAFASHDVNRLAGLILWRGVGQSSALATLRSLSAWLQQPLDGITIARATGPPLAADAPAPAETMDAPADNAGAAPPTGFEISAGGNTRDFGVLEFSGCWWLTF